MKTTVTQCMHLAICNKVPSPYTLNSKDPPLQKQGSLGHIIAAAWNQTQQEL